jgi:hypothetical protein
MNKRIWAGAVALLGVAALGASWAMTAPTPARAQAPAQDHGPKGKQSCFYSREVNSWAPVDRTTVNIRVHIDDVYQLKLLGACPNTDWDEGVGLEHFGSPWICSGLDAELIVPQPGAAPPMHCPVSSIRKLSKEEAAALPPKQHP